MSAWWYVDRALRSLIDGAVREIKFNADLDVQKDHGSLLAVPMHRKLGVSPLGLLHPHGSLAPPAGAHSFME